MASSEKKIIREAAEKMKSLIEGKAQEAIDASDCSDETVKNFIASLNQLFTSCSEIHGFIVPLSKGELDVDVPSKTNLLASPFKELHSKLRHLTWQAEQVAKGDYNQRVDFMGDFSKAFNEMVLKLAQKEKVLQAKIKELLTALENQLTKSLEEKDILLREIHHRVKNNMQVISSILQLQSVFLQDEKARDIFKDCQARIKSMALVHDRLYLAENATMIDCKEYIETFSGELFSAYCKSEDGISLKLDVEDLRLSLETAIPIGLILNELITNSLKHAFINGTGTLEVSLKKLDEEKLELNVKDNGIGLPENLDIKNSSSMGLQIVSILTNQLGGELKVRESGSAEFSISFQREWTNKEK